MKPTTDASSESQETRRATQADPDSRARTHLASERTFLAWLRTGVTCVTLGLAAAQFLTRDLVPGVPLTRGLAIVLVFQGVLVTLNGAYRYGRQIERINESDFRPATTTVIVATILMVLVGLMATLFILLLRR